MDFSSRGKTVRGHVVRSRGLLLHFGTTNHVGCWFILSSCEYSGIAFFFVIVVFVCCLLLSLNLNGSNMKMREVLTCLSQLLIKEEYRFLG